MITSATSSSTEKICAFLEEIGIPVHFKPISEETFLPGILIENGALIIDRDKLMEPGDILHEAGHLAVMTPEKRKSSNGNIGIATSENDAAGEELMAICWSYAALHKLEFPPSVVFHPNGYKGGSDWLIEQFTSGIYIGLPTLEWIGLCHSKKKAAEQQTQPFPYMQKWLRD